ncbi:MAG TPA: hypothetical protein VK858_13640, partial [Longimicrobiales bacterium]|nr:hypothetical protein [Longimicrobiales bacterium]
MKARLSGLMVVLGLAAGPAAAQVELHVVDVQGRPIRAVQVEVYGTGELLESVSTGPTGRVTLSTARWAAVRRIHLSHLGFQTLVLPVGDVRDGSPTPVSPACRSTGARRDPATPSPSASAWRPTGGGTESDAAPWTEVPVIV